MRRRRDGLIGYLAIAQRLGKSLGYVYSLSCTDPDWPPVEKQEGTQKLFHRSAIDYYARGKRWYRTRS